MSDESTPARSSDGDSGGGVGVGGGGWSVASELFSTRVVEGVHVVRFSRPDVVDAQYIELLGDDICRHVKTIDAPRVVIDMGNVRFFSSAALGMLIALKKVLEKQNGAIRIASVADEIEEVFKITKLNKLIGMHATVEKAVASLG